MQSRRTHTSRYTPRCILTWSIHHSPKLSSVAMSAAVTLSSRLSPHSMQGCRADPARDPKCWL
ncbi:hypothetical protein GMOD_00001777 [Pyrenophora seminiperda CCB06]|uniref:Uncharacterized protein n=1 Tax=Pyrenophora seminiperda CCB06 TaxID=1302712 RepID=A0A3M7LWD2_9PLEO|nr:hypothetical protein GMOD_00001777 [Pyrenophora seminiperda CCB06]